MVAFLDFWRQVDYGTCSCYENLCAEVLSENMKMCKILQANVLIEKFSPSWSDYKNWLKHKKDLTLWELINHMRTEEANRLKDNMDSVSLNSSKTNLVEFALPTSRDMHKDKGKKNQKPNYAK